MLHQETHGIAAASATKTFIQFFRGRYGKRGGLFVVKRAKSQVIGTPFFQFYEFAHHIMDVDFIQDLLYGLLGNQMLSSENEPLINTSFNKKYQVTFYFYLIQFDSGFWIYQGHDLPSVFIINRLYNLLNATYIPK